LTAARIARSASVMRSRCSRTLGSSAASML
jgi:hypothetical protein